MSISSVRRALPLIAALVWIAAMAPPSAAAQGTGVVTGSVVDASSQKPLGSVQVQVVGTTRGTITGDDGKFRIAGLPAGPYSIRVLRVGYQASTRTVQVGEGVSADVSFSLTPVAISLETVVTTATGETERKRETGSAVSVLQPVVSQVVSAQSASQLLGGKVPGVDVGPSGGTVGSGSRIRIRGANSISLTNEPLVIVDGIRYNNNVGQSGTTGATTIGVGGQTPSRFNDINPEDIQSIEILKGPAAAAQYGTAAANGVLQITTKRGRTGKAVWNVFGEGGTIRDVTTYPPNFAQVGRTTSGARTTGCTLDAQTRAACTPVADSLVSFSPLAAAAPFINGHRGTYGGSVTGGTDQVTYYLSGSYDRQQGVFAVSQDQRANGRANINIQMRPNWNLALGTSYLTDHLRLPQNDNNTLGIISAALLGRAFDDAPGTPPNLITHGFLNNQVPQALYAIATRQDINRFENSVNTSYQPLSWLTATGVFGLDYLNRYDNEVVPPARVTFGSLPDGQRTSNPYQIYNYTANSTLSALFHPLSELSSTTKISGAFNKELIRGTQAFGAKLIAGTSSLSGTTARFAVSETNTDNKTASVLGSEDIGWKDRRFLSLAIRNDKNSAFGQNFGSINYPSATLSWVISEEPFFPKSDLFNSLRLRAANGRSGQKPNFRDAITFFNAQTVTVSGTDQAGIVVGGTGNPDLRPERSRETELGFDAGFLNQRIGFELTRYNKRTDDLLVAVPLPPTLGLTTTRFSNLGTTTNKGWEFSVTTKLLDMNDLGLNATLNGFTNTNNVITIGKLPNDSALPPIVVNTQQQIRVGVPLGSYFQRAITFNDANNDGIIARSEVTLSDTAVYLGNPFPRKEYSVSPELRVMSWLRVSALIDHKDGYKLFNNTRRFRCSFNNCREAYDKNTPLADQAANIGIALGTDAGYIEDAAFTKLRELSFTITMPQAMDRMLGGRNANLTIAGRNLHTWTKYTGFDPEINSTPGLNFSTSDFLTLPPTRTWSARLSFNF